MALKNTLRCRPVAVRQHYARHRIEGAKKAQSAGDDVKVLRSAGFRVECDIFRVLNEGFLAVLKG